MTESEPQRLRVLIVNEAAERLELVAGLVESLGHTVIARELNVDQVGQATHEERPDVALVGLGASSEQALEQISQIVGEAACPVIALLGDGDAAFVSEAAKRGVFGYITEVDGPQLPGAIEIALRRFAEYHNLERAFGRRAVIERAKGILMERHGTTDAAAFKILRDHSQHTGRKLFDVARAVVDSHRLMALSLTIVAISECGVL
jgi:AmiR/NasT family two-component response regulator